MKKGIDLGKYDLNKLLRNPATIHSIQDGLIALKGGGILGEAIRTGAKKNVTSCLKMIASQYQDNPSMITEIVGKEILNLIGEYNGKALAEDIPSELFSKPGSPPIMDIL